MGGDVDRSLIMPAASHANDTSIDFFYLWLTIVV